MRLDALVLRVPNVHVGALVRVAAARGVGRRDLFLHAKENALVVVAPVERRAVAHDPALREPSAFDGSSLTGAYSVSPSAACTFGTRAACCRARASCRRPRP